MASQLPRISHVLELILYAQHLPRSVDFYRSTLRLGEPFLSNDRLAGFSLGNGTTLLLFQRGATTKDSPMRAPEQPSPVGTPAVIPWHGLGQDQENIKLKTHFALAVDKPEDVDVWEKELSDKKVPLLGKVQWPGGGRSVYFADPDDHVGELASHGIWPHY